MTGMEGMIIKDWENSPDKGSRIPLIGGMNSS